MTEAGTETRREVVVDTALAALYEQRIKVGHTLDSNTLTLGRLAGAKARHTRTGSYMDESADVLAARVEARLAEGCFPAYEIDRVKRALEQRRELHAERERISAAMKPLNAEYEANPWSRFFLVQNHGGHIHSTMHCSTCFPTTRFGWLPELSGLTEKDAVDAYGPLLCSVCYPTAPVEWTLGRAPKDDPSKCPASGSYAQNTNRKRYVECPECNAVVSITSTGKLRTHKRPKGS